MTIGTSLADGVAKVAERAVWNLYEVKKARRGIYGAVEPLEGITAEADHLISALTMLKTAPPLQTAGVGQQTLAIMNMTSLLQASMLVMGADNCGRYSEPHELHSDDYEYAHLENMYGQLGNARAALTDQILIARVGLQGNARDGWAVSRGVLVDVNSEVRRVLGIDLVLFQHLEQQMSIQTGALIYLDESDLQRLGLPRVSGPMVEKRRSVKSKTRSPRRT
ncbi:hypothetical protein B0T25DRAFT_530726 [Lasiosphaeria hispida]|uniref:Uncharacterized protein n=1 Tax=Lasiosphaeria hispida TaxID=260671 RepID=A0AAJ0HXT1_9PEZI|nr:hypothetical protein B0T25DRAFT_530726 [Lasiosphaeria hispida]